MKGIEPAFQQDDVRCLASDVDRARDGNADVRCVQRRCIVDPVAHEADDVPAGLESLDDPVLLTR